VDANDRYIFPGFIDPHVHIYLPFMATFAKDTHQTASIAALIGGTTTYIEMCCPSRLDDALEGYQLWKSKAEGNSACDYSFHMAVSKYDSQTESQLREIVRDGISSFKVFLAYKGFFGVDDRELYQVLTLARKLGVIVTAHCENAELVAQLQEDLIRALCGRTRRTRRSRRRCGHGVVVLLHQSLITPERDSDSSEMRSARLSLHVMIKRST